MKPLHQLQAILLSFTRRYVTLNKMRCCVVGCGAAGIIAAKHLKAQRIEFDVFEMTDDIGGTWVYTEKDTDSHGTPVHTAMYKNLRTNLPKEVMEYDGFKYESEKSFLSSKEVHQYLKNFVNKFTLMDDIKLGHIVKKIWHKENGWKVKVINTENREENINTYDAVIICNGHYSKPRLPNIDGMKDFKGIQMHSKNYRIPEIFKDKTLLVVGYGPSGQDITIDASSQASKVFLSHHATNFKETSFQDNVFSKPDVKRINTHSVTFKDDSTETIDAILYCTGYYYSYPFLDESCGISVDDNYVTPLFKQFISVTHPSMAFIGLNFKSFLFPLFEIQVKAFIEVLLGRSKLPAEMEMKEELDLFEKRKKEEGVAKRKYHQISNIREYIGQVRSVANLPDLPPVIYDIYYHTYHNRIDSLVQYRKFVYNVIDDNNFTYHITDK